MEEPTALYKSEDVLKRLKPAGDTPQAELGADLGGWAGLGMLKPLKLALAAAKVKRAKAAAAAVMGAGLGTEGAVKSAGYADGGSVHNDPLEDALDRAYMNAKF